MPHRLACLPALLILTLLGFLGGCDSQDLQRAFEEDASQPPADFTRTDDCGEEPERVDEDDWRTSPLYRGTIATQPACPNPSRFGQNIIVQFTITQTNAVQGASLTLRAYDASGRLALLDGPIDGSLPGIVDFSFPAGLLPRQGLQRLFVFDGASNLVTYGDVMVE